MKLKIIELTL